MDRIQKICVIVWAALLSAVFVPAEDMKHVIVASDPSFFYGWPANEGMWSWGDEIVVGFNKGTYRYNDSGHSCAGQVTAVQARSRNGGLDWQIETPEVLNDKAILPKHTEPLDLTHPGFAFKVRNGRYWYSYDKAALWNGPYEMPGWGLKARGRTDYIVLSPSAMKLFLVADVSDDSKIYNDRAFCAETTDGCLTFKKLGWMCPAPHVDWGRNNICTMPSTVKIDDATYISAIRRRDRHDMDGDGKTKSKGDINRKYIDIYKTSDGGSSWNPLAEDVVVGAWNPPSMILLADGRICLTYGYRGSPQGIYAKISNDNGVTWGPEILLRNDAVTWDMGYPRSVQRPDGKVVTVYYYSTTEIPEQHIAATIWTP